MYNVGELGDCFLLTFKEGTSVCRVLIDCGSFRNSKASISRMQLIANHLKKELKNDLIDIVVGTHQHNDHVSGFVHAETIFKDLVDKVWLSWLDNPADPFARRVYNEQKKLLATIKQIYGNAKKAGIAQHMYAVKDILSFYSVNADDGGDPEIPAKGIEILKSIGKKPVEYLNPGDRLPLPNFNQSQVKVYVLGPPRKRELLFDKDPKKGESYDHSLALELASNNADKILSAVNNRLPGVQDRDESEFPFNNSFKNKEIDKDLKKIYRADKNKWRVIDNDWLEDADSLALFLDTFTNNSSLVLAFELVKSGKVLLFAADAQTGNWLSWDSIKWKGVKAGFTTKTLLENTVLYKVGHHGSHNATLVAGLEAMHHEELVAMIPVDKNDPNIKGSTPKPGSKKKPRTWKMPAKNLFKRLKEKTKNRVLRMDEGFAEGCSPTVPNSTWKKLPNKPIISKDKLYVEYTIEG